MEFEVIYPERNTLVRKEDDDSKYKHNLILNFGKGIFEAIANDYDGGTEGSRRTYKGTLKSTKDGVKPTENGENTDGTNGISGTLEFQVTDAEYYLYGSGAAEWWKLPFDRGFKYEVRYQLKKYIIEFM